MGIYSSRATETSSTLENFIRTKTRKIIKGILGLNHQIKQRNGNSFSTLGAYEVETGKATTSVSRNDIIYIHTHTYIYSKESSFHTSISLLSYSRVHTNNSFSINADPSDFWLTLH